MNCAACGATLDPGRILRRRQVMEENYRVVIVVAYSCAGCLAACERDWHPEGADRFRTTEGQWSAPRVWTVGSVVTRLRERAARASRSELCALLGDDETGSLLSTPEIERDVREALGSTVRLKATVTIVSSESWSVPDLPRLAPVLSSDCRQAFMSTEDIRRDPDAAVFLDEDRHPPRALLVKGTRFPLLAIREGWLTVELPPFAAEFVKRRKSTDPMESIFRVDPALLDPD